MYKNETWPKYYLSVVECKSCTISLKFMVAMATRRFLKRILSRLSNDIPSVKVSNFWYGGI